jgi:uncharacterized protein YjbI with pentapeptide repeats
MAAFELSVTGECRDERIAGFDFSRTAIEGREFSDCVFESCNFSESKLDGSVFDGCVFRSCNLSVPSVRKAKLLDVRFEDCKIAGINFYHFDQMVFDVSFVACQIQNCNFSGLKMKKAGFEKCRISECDFKDCFLVEASFKEAEFKDTVFHNANLQKASFYEAKGYRIDPRTNNVKMAVFCIPEVLSLIECFGVDIRNP